MSALTELPAWRALEAHAQDMSSVSLRALFAEHPDRFDRFHVRFEDLLFDYSKQRITSTTRDALVALAEARGLPEARRRMFAGEKINTTEGRAVLHTALRAAPDAVIEVDG
ncbi:MAG: glucose-6-phosphate isomerase, partial [Myxococcota bacterium]